MREIRQSGSEGGGLKPMSPPYPYICQRHGHGEDAKTVPPDEDGMTVAPELNH